MWLIIIFAVFYLFWRKFKPEIEYICEARMWICHYNRGKGRDWFIIFKE